MATFDKAGKTANEIIEKAIDVTEEIAVRAVDAIDMLTEMTMDMAQSAQGMATETGDYVKKKAAEASAAVARTTQNIADKMEEYAQKNDKKDE